MASGKEYKGAGWGDRVDGAACLLSAVVRDATDTCAAFQPGPRATKLENLLSQHTPHSSRTHHVKLDALPGPPDERVVAKVALVPGDERGVGAHPQRGLLVVRGLVVVVLVVILSAPLVTSSSLLSSPASSSYWAPSHVVFSSPLPPPLQPVRHTT